MEDGEAKARNAAATGDLQKRLQATEKDLAAAQEELAALRDDYGLLAQQLSAGGSGERPGDEIRHRVRNLFAVIRSIFARSAANTASAEDLADHFRGRLEALARYEVSSARAPTGAVDLETMVRDELLTTGFGDGPRIAIDGPVVLFRGKVAELFGLALHELVTNSVKFGTLGDVHGRGALDIRWTAEEDSVCFRWHESGVAVLSPAPMRSGFGREFIEQALPYEIGAETSFEIIPGGVACSIRFGADR
jgi:two-component sensor histidine kinase